MLKLLDGYLFKRLASRIALVLIGLVSMFAFFELVTELGHLGKSGYDISNAVLYILFKAPSFAYELLPLAMVVGALWAMSELALSNEFTVMRMSSYSPSDFVQASLWFALPVTLGIYVLSEAILPWAENHASKARAFSSSASGVQTLRSGHWFRDPIRSEGILQLDRFVNVGEPTGISEFKRLTIYEFDQFRRLRRYIRAERATFDLESSVETAGWTNWRLRDVVRLEVDASGRAMSTYLPAMEYRSGVAPSTLSALLVQPEKMTVVQLHRYVNYLREATQSSSRYELAMWRKVAHPLSALAMLMLALPLAYAHTRSGYLGLKVFLGIGVGLAFHLFNSLFAHLTILGDWPAAAVAITPSLVAMLIALSVLQMAQRRAL